MNRYWDNEGRYENEAKELNTLMPSMGKCETLRGELWRAASKIYYDYYNNGFGNSWEAPAQFLMDHLNLPDSITNVFYEYGGGHICSGSEENAMEAMIDTVIEQIYVMEDQETTDMWDTEFESGLFPEYIEDEYYDWDDEEEYA